MINQLINIQDYFHNFVFQSCFCGHSAVNLIFKIKGFKVQNAIYTEKLKFKRYEDDIMDECDDQIKN